MYIYITPLIHNRSYAPTNQMTNGSFNDLSVRAQSDTPCAKDKVGRIRQKRVCANQAELVRTWRATSRNHSWRQLGNRLPPPRGPHAVRCLRGG